MTNKNWYFILHNDYKLISSIYTDLEGSTEVHSEYDFSVQVVQINSRQHAIRVLEVNPSNEWAIYSLKKGKPYTGLPDQTPEEIAESIANPPRTKGTYIGVFVAGGIVEKVDKYTYLEDGMELMMAYCREYGFDPEVDDARIFKVRQGHPSKEVYSVQIEEYTSAGS